MADEQVVELTIRLRVVLQVSVEAVAEPAEPAAAVGAMSTSMTPKLPQPPLADCMSCGFTDAECQAVIRLTQASRSCCGTCKNTNTHPLLAAIKEV